MLRKFIFCILILIFAVSLSSIAYANPESNITEEVKPFFRLNNLPRNMTTNDANLFISFNASEKSNVTISVFHNTSLANDEEKFVLSDTPLKVEVGTIQRGFAEVVLKKGTNKVEFKVDFDKGDELIVTRTITLKDIEEARKQLAEGIQNTRDNIKNIFITTGTSPRP